MVDIKDYIDKLRSLLKSLYIIA